MTTRINKYILTAMGILTVVSPAFAADTTLSGIIKDGSTDLPIAGVRVSVFNGEGAAISNNDGQFSIPFMGKEAVLRVEMNGYDVRFVPVSIENKADIILQPSTGLGYDLGAYTSAVPSNSTTLFPISEINADQGLDNLQGDVFTITRSGMAGSGVSTYIDGLHSLSSSSQPLYVVDGVIWPQAPDNASVIEGYFYNPLSLIDPRDIAKMTVLKDGSGIYGAKGGNGVILIETRRGEDAATRIEAFAMLGIHSPGKKMPVMNASQYRTYVSDILKGRYENSTQVGNLNFLNDDPTSPGYFLTHNNTDWQNLTTHTGLLMNYGINVRGGDDRALYAFSFGYAKGDGSIRKTSFDRLNIRFNSDINLWRGFKLRFDIAFAQATRKLFDDGINAVSSPGYLSMVKSPLFHPNVLTSLGGVTNKYADVDELGTGNPLSIIDLGVGHNRTYRFNLNALPRYDFNEKWAVQGRVSYTFDKAKENSFLPDYGVEETDMVNNNGEIYAVSKNRVKSQMGRLTSFDMDIHGEYNPLKNIVNDLSFMLGYRFTNDTYLYSYGEGHNTSSDYMNDLSNTTSSLHFSDGLDSKWRNMAWYLTANYNLLNRYLFSAEVDMETSSKFGKEAPGALHIGGVSWGLFPKVNAAWIISAEPWMRNVDWLSLLKLYATYSLTGNDNVPIYATKTYYQSSSFMDNAFGWTVANLGNPKLKWESTSTFRVGLDMKFFNDRWMLGGDFFYSTTSDLLMKKNLESEVGLATMWTNNGSLRNIGFNISTIVRAVNLRDWKLDIAAGVGHYANRLTKLNGGSFTTDILGAQILTQEGSPIGLFYGYKTNGVYATASEANNAHIGIRNNDGSVSYFSAGDMIFEDFNHDGLIDEKDRVVIGNPNPDVYGNFSFRLQWKNLSLSSLFTFVAGNDVYNALRANLESGSTTYNQSVALLNRWVANGHQTDIPRATYGDPMGNSRFSDRWIEDGSYLKWKSLELSYEIPLKSSFIQGLSVSVAMNNILTFTKYLGPDPEFSYGMSPLYLGVDAGLTSPGREFCFGIKINL